MEEDCTVKKIIYCRKDFVEDCTVEDCTVKKTQYRKLTSTFGRGRDEATFMSVFIYKGKYINPDNYFF